MRLALFQSPPTDGDVADALLDAGRLLRGAAALGARMLVLPELFLPGYNRPDLHGLLAQTRDGHWIHALGRLAREAGCGLTFGWAERDGERIYNAATALGPDGAVLAHYRKIQLYGPMETGIFTPGEEAPPVFEFGGRRIGLLICYDIEFPEHTRSLARRGAGIVLVPTACPAQFDYVPQTLVPARAHESRLVIAYANYCGSEAGIDYGGRSVIVGPDAHPLASAGLHETMLVVDLPGASGWDQGRLSTQLQDYRAIG